MGDLVEGRDLRTVGGDVRRASEGQVLHLLIDEVLDAVGLDEGEEGGDTGGACAHPPRRMG